MDIIKNRYKFFAVSLIIIAIGLVTMIVNFASGKGALNFDIEFTGGTSMQFDIGKEFDNKENIYKILNIGFYLIIQPIC